ncbi:MAG: acyltransferase [Bacteroidales bacterium]
MTLSLIDTNRIFSINNIRQFNEAALEIFHYQYHNNEVYRAFLSHLGTDMVSVSSYLQIPCLPVELFKTQRIISGSSDALIQFHSSGSTGIATSTHYVIDIELYKRSFLTAFESFYGNPEEYIILGLLPSYLERLGSSLVFMVDELIRLSHHPLSSFYLHDHQRLNESLELASQTGRKVLLLGVSYALLDFCESFPQENPNLIVMETGGMKGRRTEMTREELHELLKKGFKVPAIHSEYGMTELLSQSYSKGNGIFRTPPWMKITIRDSEDPFSILPAGKTGGINIIDLANLHSCSFISTQDLGKCIDEDSFEILGRFDSSDIRGCNLLIS